MARTEKTRKNREKSKKTKKIGVLNSITIPNIRVQKQLSVFKVLGKLFIVKFTNLVQLLCKGKSRLNPGRVGK